MPACITQDMHPCPTLYTHCTCISTYLPTPHPHYHKTKGRTPPPWAEPLHHHSSIPSSTSHMHTHTHGGAGAGNMGGPVAVVGGWAVGGRRRRRVVSCVCFLGRLFLLLEDMDEWGGLQRTYTCHYHRWGQGRKGDRCPCTYALSHTHTHTRTEGGGALPLHKDRTARRRFFADASKLKTFHFEPGLVYGALFLIVVVGRID